MILTAHVTNVKVENAGQVQTLCMVPSSSSYKAAPLQMGTLNMVTGQRRNRGLGASGLPGVGNRVRLRAGPPHNKRLRRGAPAYRAACWSGCRWARADGPSGKHNRNQGVNAGKGRAIARSFSGHNCHTARQKRRPGEDCARPGERPRKRVREGRAEPSPGPPG